MAIGNDSTAFEVGWRVARITAASITLTAIQGCAHHRSATAPIPPGPSGDSIALVSMRQVDATRLTAGEPARFEARLQYTLSTFDQATLSIDLVQFSNRDSCSSDMGQIIQAAHVAMPITRGTHLIDVPLTWPGGALPAGQDNIPASGAVSVQSSMGLIQPPYQFLLRSFGTQFCLRF